MFRLLLGLGVALWGLICALGWQISALPALGWMGAAGLIAGGSLMLWSLFDTPAITTDDDGEIIIDGVEYTIR